MIYLQAIRRKVGRELPREEFPFSLPMIQTLDELRFEVSVTFFVGENGSGKSTLLEAIAAGLNSIAMGSEDLRSDPSLEMARRLADGLRFVRGRSPRRGFFFRAEDAFGFVKRVQREGQDLEEMADHFDRTLSGYGRQLAVGVAKGSRHALDRRYGRDPDARSHGESFLELLKSRLVPGGLYLMDEPETPLSPLRQLALISLMKSMVEQECQFIVATHSPILMAFPDAAILTFNDPPIHPIEYDQVEHVSLTRAFLNDPERFLRQL